MSDGSTLRLMPYYTGGPAGPLVLTIAVQAEAGPLPLPQDGAEVSVPESMPDTELPAARATALRIECCPSVITPRIGISSSRQILSASSVPQDQVLLCLSYKAAGYQHLS